MKKIFTLIAVAAMALSANAQKVITFGDVDSDGKIVDATVKAEYADGDFKLTYVDTNGKLAVDGNPAYFGTADSNQKFVSRLKSGGKSDASKLYLTLTVPAKGTLSVFARTGSNSAEDRTVVLTQNDTELYNKVVKEADAIMVKGLDSSDADKETKVYPAITVSVEAGTVTVTFPINSINFYAFSFLADGEEPGDDTGISTVKVAENTNAAIFNLAGQQVGKNYKGVVIQNGVKRIQK